MTHFEQQPEAPRPFGAEYVDDLVLHAPSRRAAHALASLFTEHGSVAAHYLSLTGVDPYSETLAEDFTNSYIGSFDSPQSLVESELESHDWGIEFSEFMARAAIPEDFLTWNYAAIYAFLVRHIYDIVDFGGTLHVFSK